MHACTLLRMQCETSKGTHRPGTGHMPDRIISRKSQATGNRRPAGGRAWLFHLGNQGVADHDLRHPLGEFENIVPHPIRRLLIGGKCLVRAVKYADCDQHVRAAIKQMIGPEPLHARVWQGAPLNQDVVSAPHPPVSNPLLSVSDALWIGHALFRSTDLGVRQRAEVVVDRAEFEILVGRVEVRPRHDLQEVAGP